MLRNWFDQYKKWENEQKDICIRKRKRKRKEKEKEKRTPSKKPPFKLI